MSRVAVVTDNSAGVPLDLAVELGIEVVPVDVIVGGETLRWERAWTSLN